MRAVPVADGSAWIRYLEIPGADPPLIWLHGLLCSSTGELMAAAVQPSLGGRRSLLVDFLGYGYSDKPEGFGYSLEDHADTLVTLLEDLQVDPYILVGHSFGGSVATLVAAARPNLVAALVLGEPSIDPGGVTPPGIAAQSEDAFAEQGFADLLAGMQKATADNPRAPAAAHVGITQLVSPRGLHRASVSAMRGTEPPIRRVLAGLSMPRFYLGGANSDQALPPQDDLVSAGVRWLTVPDTAHAMGLINPAGFAATVAEALAQVGL